jgi:glycosyltransferase involved in cell wall biosynthesis
MSFNLNYDESLSVESRNLYYLNIMTKSSNIVSAESCDISVIICTKNRQEKLFETIDSIVSQKTNNDINYEILIIDSSYDNSIKNKILKRYSNSVNYYWNSNLNLSEARNFGINLARGKIIAFIDDDGIAEESWLLEHYKMYTNPSVVSVGGKIVPKWSSEIPKWLSSEVLAYFGGYLSILDIGPSAKQITFPEIPYGCNMSFRKDIFHENIFFDRRFGRMGDTLISNEELYLYYLLGQKGKKVMYTPFAIVNHQIDSTRMTKSFFDRRSYWDGVSDARMHKIMWNKNQRLSKFLKFFYLKIPKNMMGYILYSWFLRKSDQAFYYKLKLIYRLAYIIELIRF